MRFYTKPTSFGKRVFGNNKFTRSILRPIGGKGIIIYRILWLYIVVDEK